VDVGGEMLDARSDVVEGAERLDVAVPIRLVDLRDKTSGSIIYEDDHTSSPLPTTLPSTQMARKLACLSSHCGK
jgi:hypothetical protein